jgi:integrase
VHIRKHKDGWRVIVQHRGVKRSEVTATKRDAQRRGAEMQLEFGQQTVTATTATLQDLIAMHIAASTEWAVTTRTDYGHIANRLPDWMTAWRVVDITPHMIDGAYQRLTADGWTPSRVRKLHTLLSTAFKRALRYGWIRTNPVTAAAKPKEPATHLTVPDPADVRRLLEAADTTLGAALRFLATTGVRRGELCALQWDDIDLDHAAVTIRRSVTTTKNDPHHITSGKTGAKGHRVIGLGAATITALQAHRLEQKEHLLAIGSPRSVPWVFTHDGINPWRTDYLTREFIRLRRRIGVDGIRLHDLRHFVATELLGSGVDIRTVSGRLGHARASTTLDKYAAFLPARDREAADIMEGRLSG